MSDPKKWLEELRTRWGVPADFCRTLSPVVEDLASRGLSRDEREIALEAIALASRSQSSLGLAGDSVDEVRVLVGEFILELKKMDESLKVLSTYLERVRTQMGHLPTERIVH